LQQRSEQNRIVIIAICFLTITLAGGAFVLQGCARSKSVRSMSVQDGTDHGPQHAGSFEPSAGSLGEDGQEGHDGGLAVSPEGPGESAAPRARVCLDPGHPSFEDDRLYEAIINRKVAFYVKELLEGAGYQVLMTTSDLTEEEIFAFDFNNDGASEQSRLEVLSLEDRAEACNGWHGEYFISVHHNKGFDVTRNITAVYYGQNQHFRPWHEDAPIWAQLTAMRLYEVMATNDKKSGGDQNRLGLSLTVLEKVDAVGILTEASFYSHPEERSRLNQNPYLEKEAKAIVDGFIAFAQGL
jgi:N-acetylmuramoyl-L-alanine amidase